MAIPSARRRNLPIAERARNGSETGPRARRRFLLYSHDGVGLGHVRRNLNIAAALRAARPDAAVLLATGAEELDAFTLPDGVDALRLPGLRKLDNRRYAARRLAVSAADLHSLRAGLLAAAVEAYQPDVLVADKHPGGAQGELLPALGQLRAYGGRAALGLRDVLDDPTSARREWNHSGASRHLADFYDRVLVYGQRDLLDPLAQCGLPESVRRIAHFCGYVATEARCSPPPRRARGRRPTVVAMAGGGVDGVPVLRAFIETARDEPWNALVVAGPQMADVDRGALERLAAGRVPLLSSVRDLGSSLADVDAVVCMGGYNTMVEVLSAAVPAVCVPRVTPRVEQLIRARAFAERGLVRLIEPVDLCPGRLRTELDAALDTDRAALAARVASTIELEGASRGAAALVELADPAHDRRRLALAR